MKDSDKVTLSIGQLKKLIKENYKTTYNDTRWLITYSAPSSFGSFRNVFKLVINAKDKSEAINKFKLYSENEKEYLELSKIESVTYID